MTEELFHQIMFKFEKARGAEGDRSSPAATRQRTQTKQARPYRILVVDDEPEIVTYASALLKRHNYEVIAATKGKEAVELAKLHKPDLILLDIIIPDMSGQEVAEELMNDAGCKNIPIILLTGILTKQEESPGKKTGRHLILAKPIVSQDLLDMIKNILSSP